MAQSLPFGVVWDASSDVVLVTRPWMKTIIFSYVFIVQPKPKCRRIGRRRRATTPNKDRYLVLTARRHENMNAIFLQQHLRSATCTTVSTHDCPKPPPWCRSACSPTDGMC
ncbi:hypothetical protein TNCV_978771 [Trichonephila clavipes]|nr:hypothetical protein TNCV_978771 [Trichonephila clavipes]